MKLAYRKQQGYILCDAARKTRLDSLTQDDSYELMQGHLKYDRRKSFAKERNRKWADGIDW